MSGTRRTVLAIATLVLVVPAYSRAQAILPEKGEGSVSMLFTNSLATKHYLPATAFDRGRIDANSLLVDFTFGLSDRVAFSVSLPFVATRYRGRSAHLLQNGQRALLDDGSWHVTPQDLRFGVRYNLIQRGVVITPFVGTVTPSHRYDFFAHASPGRATKESLAGVSAARVFTGSRHFRAGTIRARRRRARRRVEAAAQRRPGGDRVLSHGVGPTRGHCFRALRSHRD